MIKVRIPATSANIGSGFDSLGLALDLYNYIYMEEYDGIWIESKDGTDIPTDQTNLVYETAKSLYELCGRPFPGLHIQQISHIPLARGLGSRGLAGLFALCCVGASLGGGNLVQANSIADALSAAFGWDRLAVGLGVALAAGAVLVGGVGRIGRVSERLVPAMALLFLAGGLCMLIPESISDVVGILLVAALCVYQYLSAKRSGTGTAAA